MPKASPEPFRPQFTPGNLPDTVPAGSLCAACMYELEGLATDSVCPECGKPITESLTGDTLVDADPVWLEKVYKGFRRATRAFAWTVILICVSLILWIGSEVWMSLSPNAVLERVFKVAGAVLGAVNLTAAILTPFFALHGWFAATRPEPDRFDDRVNRIRARARWTAVIWLVVTVLSFTGLSIASIIATTTGTSGTLIAWAIHGTAASFHYWYSMNYIRMLANRVPDPKLVRKARTESKTLIIGATLGIIVCGLGPIIAFIVYLSILDRVHNTLRPIVQWQAKVAAAAQQRPSAEQSTA